MLFQFHNQMQKYSEIYSKKKNNVISKNMYLNYIAGYSTRPVDLEMKPSMIKYQGRSKENKGKVA